MNIKPILFIDFDGTLCYDRFWRSLDAGNYVLIQNFLTENKTLTRDWMKGNYSSEEINRLVSKKLDIPFGRLWKVFVCDCKNMTISKDTLNRIKKLNKDFKTILVTDNMDCFSRFTVPAKKLNAFFDQIVNSFENKKLKEFNGGEVFIQLADRVGAKIENCILIDDSRTTGDEFSKLGGKACLVTLKTPLDYWLEQLEDELAGE